MIQPENLHAVWDYVKKGLDRVQEASPEHWRQEDVYAQCRYKLASLYVGYDGERRLGFFITQALKQPFSGKLYLNVWILWAEPVRGDHFADVRAFMGETMGFIDECAKYIGAKTIQMAGRAGWSRYLKEYFKAQQVVYEREV